MGEPGGEHGVIGARIIAALMAFVGPRGLGFVLMPTEYQLLLPGEARRQKLGPDVSFVAKGRWPLSGTPEYKQPWKIAPDLAVEIASPTQSRSYMAGQADKYLRAGTRLVWVVYPSRHEMDIWRPGQERQTLRAKQQIDEQDVLPGFTCSLAAFFPDLDER